MLVYVLFHLGIDGLLRMMTARSESFVWSFTIQLLSSPVETSLPSQLWRFIMKKIFTATLFVAAVTIVPFHAFAQSESRDDVLKQIQTKRAELSALEKKFLGPSEEDKTTYAEYVGQQDRGLIRLLPREVYDKETTLTIRGGGSYYSFTRLTHAYGYGSDISFEQGFLKVGFAGADYGMLINVGDVPLEEINVEHPRVKFLSGYTTVLEEPQARAEQRRFGAGTTIDGVNYCERVRAQVKATYVVRSINYSGSDVLVGFRGNPQRYGWQPDYCLENVERVSVPDPVQNSIEQ